MGLLLGLTLLASGCDPLDGSAGAGPGGGAGAGAGGNAIDVAGAKQTLAALTVGTWASMSGYSRDRFPHWSSQGQGCDTRDVVLKRDGSGVQATADCKITKGSWFSVYDGKTLTDPQELDVDHMVPLANAWRTGAKEWDDAKREKFANDLAAPQLLAVTAASNRSKGDQDPFQWKPPRRDYWCEYAGKWIAVKAKWGLIVTSDEKAALGQMLEGC